MGERVCRTCTSSLHVVVHTARRGLALERRSADAFNDLSPIIDVDAVGLINIVAILISALVKLMCGPARHPQRR